MTEVIYVHNPWVPVKETKTKKKRQGVFNWKHLWKYLGRQVIWRQAKTLYYSLPKKKSHWNRILSTKNLPIDRANRSIDLCVLQNACHELFCVFGNYFRFFFVRDAGSRGNKITGQLKTISHIARKTNLSRVRTQCERPASHGTSHIQTINLA